jgi:hypothetical protein
MTIETWWPRLRTETRRWLLANNGDVVPPLIMEEIAAEGGPVVTDAWWADSEGSAGRVMPDEAVDWIEEAANDEEKGDRPAKGFF